MANYDLAADALLDVGFDPRYAYQQTPAWPMPIHHHQNQHHHHQYAHPANPGHHHVGPTTSSQARAHDHAAVATTRPGATAATGPAAPTAARHAAHNPYASQQSNTTSPASHSPTLLTDWPLHQAHQAHQAQQHQAHQHQHQVQQVAYHDAAPLSPHFMSSFAGPFPSAALDMMPTSQALPMDGQPLAMDRAMLPLAGPPGPLEFSWEDFPLMTFADDQNPTMPDGTLGPVPAMAESSPTDTFLEVRSLTSSGSEGGWGYIDYHHPLESYRDPQSGAIFNPGQTLHIRTDSESSDSDVPAANARHSLDSMDEVLFPITSPDSDGPDLAYPLPPPDQSRQTGSAVSPAGAAAEPVPIKESVSPHTSPSSHASSSLSSPPARRPAAAAAKKSSPTAKSTKPVIRRQSQTTTKKDAEKRVGRRRGPLRPDQRKQASEIRKLRACLRCKFLKKTCDQGSPCAGCQPAHARLWQVPCTRIDIKDVAYFMKDWKADYERFLTAGVSVSNVTNFSPMERTLHITHGYGVTLPVKVREVYVRDERCFETDWTESIHATPRDFVIDTAALTTGKEGILPERLAHYLDQHVDECFEEWVDELFEGTPFLTEVLKTAHRYYQRSKLPVIRKALKLVVAYNLTMHVTMVDGLSDGEYLPGEVTDDGSKFKGKTFAPTMINFQVKYALAETWRELQKEILEELSALYSSVYSGDKLKHWPTIFMLAAVLLFVWEEMQFDSHYRMPDPVAVDRFCTEMETTPVGVIVGLFSAISQKLPAFGDWDTRKHHAALNSDAAVCDAMTAIRGHVNHYEGYLKGRTTATFNRDDFDCLSNKFLSKLVIRAN